jgi:hypothetical protein
VDAQADVVAVAASIESGGQIGRLQGEIDRIHREIQSPGVVESRSNEGHG